MCSYAGIAKGLPSELHEKTTSLHSSQEISEKTTLPTTPDPNLSCLNPNFNPVALQKVVKEGILLSTGALAILLQIANPGVGQGVNEHSNFAYRPLDRLRTTMTYVYCMAFGTPLEKKTIIETVNRAHIPVAGPTYSADDPELQLWVAATLYGCGIDIYEKVFGKLDEATAEQCYQEYSVMATSLRVPEGMWPKTRKDFWAYWDDKIATLQITDHAKNVANDLLHNDKGPLWIRANLPLLRTLTVQWLPPRMREAYGLKNSKGRRAVHNVSMGMARTFYPLVPGFIRQYPVKFYLKDMRREMRRAAQV